MLSIVRPALRLLRTRRWIAAVVIGFAAAAGAALIEAGPLWGWNAVATGGHLELKLLAQRLSATPLPPSPKIMLISIEPGTPGRLGLDANYTVVPRRWHARLIQGLRDAGANALIFDLLFTEPRGERDDTAIRGALAQSAPLTVVLACDYDPDRSVENPDVLTGWRYFFTRPLVMPHPPCENVVCASPLAWDPQQVGTGVILLRPDARSGDWIPHLALAGVLGQYHLTPTEAAWDFDRNVVTAGPLAWQCGVDGEIVTRFTRSGVGFERLEYSEALRKIATPLGRAQFQGKLIIVGDFSGADLKPTRNGLIHGAEFVAHTVNTLMQPGTTRLDAWRLPLNFFWSWILATLASVSLGAFRWRTALCGSAAALALVFAVPYVALSALGVWIATVTPCLATLFALLMTGLVASGFAGALLPRHVRLGRPESLTEEATVLFVDLRGSTPMVEKLGAQKASEVHGALLTTLSRIVRKHGGEVERTMGDGLLALFRRTNKAHHALRAMATAQEMLEEVALLSPKWQRDFEVPAGLTLGIESGMVSGAVLNTSDMEEWSSFGLTVNTAARLQSACSSQTVDLLLGPAAWAMTQHLYAYRCVGPLVLKGIEAPVTAYTLAATDPAGPPA